MTSEERTEFGARLRRQRESRSLTIPDVAKVTKIPEKSVTLLEAGAFDELPGEVFVRGFLKSYCRSVGLDVEQTLRDYADLLGKGPKPKREPSLVRPGVARSAEHEPVPAAAVAAAAPAAPAAAAASIAAAKAAAAPAPEQKKEPAAEKPKEPDDELSLFTALRGAGRAASRVPLTLALIILVILATLTLSLLLRRPDHVGSGVSSASGAGPYACAFPGDLR